MQLDSKNLDMICLAGLAALLVGGSLLTVKAAHSRARALDEQRKVVAARMQELKQAQTVLGTLSRVLKTNQDALDALRNRLPATGDMGAFLTGLDGLMARNKVDLRQVTPGPPVTEAVCTRIPLSFSCRGPFEGLYAVLYELERMPRLVRVDQLSMNRASLSEPCTMSVSCSVYGR